MEVELSLQFIFVLTLKTRKRDQIEQHSSSIFLVGE